MRYLVNTLFITFFLFVSCTKVQRDNIIITKEFQDEEWSRFEFIEGHIEVKKVPAKFDVIMEVVVSDQYPSTYEMHQKDGAFLFNLTVSNSDGIYRSRDYRYKLKNNEGYWNSEKKNGYYTFFLPVINEMSIEEKDIYKFTIENKYSKDPLQGIKSISLKYINSK